MPEQRRPLALVTGASRGIGRAIALQLARDGYLVAINYCKTPAGAEQVHAQIASEGGQSVLCPFDIGQHAAVQEAIRKLNGDIGHVDVLVNNAAIVRDKPLTRVTQDDWNAVVATNLGGVHNCSQAVIKTWTGDKCARRIINLTSVGGDGGFAHNTTYAATKAGIAGFTRSLAIELARKAVTVNAVSPGLILTEGTAGVYHDKFVAQTPLGRAGLPEEVAYLVSFLASDKASFITGQVIRINGGMYV